ncbi:hypothetical protein F5B18DRAFT_635643 [Nemania serpens]|nr:hypothetical protein F5B18DRAFT_635643 [Nemania serpens]
MSTYTISERFTCGHIQTTHDQSTNPKSKSPSPPDFATLKDLVSDSMPLPTRCLACVCTTILSISDLRTVPRSFIRDLLAHVQILQQRASPAMKPELALVADSVRRVVDDGDVDGFRGAVLALAGYLDVSAWFGL